MHRPTTLTPIDSARRRTERLARVMYEVRIRNGACFEADLRREGFSNFEIQLYIEEARRIADSWVVRHVGAPEPEEPAGADQPAPRAARRPANPAREELVRIAVNACIGTLSDGEAANTLLHIGFSAATIADIWERFCVALATQVARMPRPAFEVAA